MANQYSENIFRAIDMIWSDRMKGLNFDKTILCKVLELPKEEKNKYLVSDSTSSFYAYGKDGDSYKVIEHLGIGHVAISIEHAYNEIISEIRKTPIKVSDQTFINLPPRLRMTTLYAVSQSVNGRVANTCNLSEAYIGWETRWGDAVGDFAPLQGLTCSEVIALGK